MAGDPPLRGVAVLGVVLVALAAAGCNHTQARVQGDTVTNAPKRTTTATTGSKPAKKGVKPAKKGEDCVLAKGGEDDPTTAMNECRDILAQFYGVNSTDFQTAWQAAVGLSECLTYYGIEECLAAG